MSQERRPQSQREQLWRELVAAWEKSGQSVRAFCARRGLQEASFYSWRRTFRERDAAAQRGPTLVPLRVLPDTYIEVVLPTGLMLRVPAGADATAVATLIAALRAASC